jgi:hypothetical protein
MVGGESLRNLGVFVIAPAPPNEKLMMRTIVKTIKKAPRWRRKNSSMGKRGLVRREGGLRRWQPVRQPESHVV